jgi:hypothetical protein
LSAQIQGWAAPEALSAYEKERHPITEQVSRFAMNHAHAMSQRRRAIPSELEEASAQGQATRQSFGQDLYDLNVQQYCCAGLNFGYYYDHSPVIAYDGGIAPEYSMGHFTPSTVPGCRAPHFMLADGRSLLDALGPAYTLLSLEPGTEPSVACLQQAAQARGMPLDVLDLSKRQDLPAEYVHPMVMVRADMHVVWRGQALSLNAAGALVNTLCGVATPATH